MRLEPLQAYLRESARGQYEAVAVPPFTAFFHPDDAFPHFNYAIPDRPVGGDLQAPLAALRAAFAARQRLPRLEFIEGYAPALASALEAAGFVEEARLHLMLCTPASYQPPPEVAGLTITRLGADTPVAEAQQFLTTQGRGFNPDDAREAPVERAEQFLQRLGSSGAFLGRLNGQPVAVATFNEPLAGLTEVVAVATLAPYRRRGLAAALTARAVQAAFAQGVEAALLTAGDERAGRVYERVGFRPHATALAFRAG